MVEHRAAALTASPTERSVNFHIEDEAVDETTHIIELGGEVDLYHAPEFKERMVELIESGKKHIIIDLSRATFTEETSLGVLVGGVKRLRPAGGSLALVCTDDNITKIFEITGLDRVFPIHSSREEALAALASDESPPRAPQRHASGSGGEESDTVTTHVLELGTADDLQEQMTELSRPGKKHIIVDLTQMTPFVDALPSPLEELLRREPELRDAGGSLAFVADASTRRVFEITRLDERFPVYGSREEALLALGCSTEHIRADTEDVTHDRREAVGAKRLTHEQLLAADDTHVFFNMDGAYESAVIAGVTYVPVPPGTYPHDWPDWIRADCESREDAEARAAHTMDALKRALAESAAAHCPPGMDEREVEQRLHALAEAVSPEGEFPSAEWLRDAREAHLRFPEP